MRVRVRVRVRVSGSCPRGEAVRVAHLELERAVHIVAKLALEAEALVPPWVGVRGSRLGVRGWGLRSWG